MNGNLLKAAAAAEGLTIRDLAKLIDMKEPTLYVKVANGNFSVGEALEIKKALNLTTKEFGNIFFDGQLS